MFCFIVSKYFFGALFTETGLNYTIIWTEYTLDSNFANIVFTYNTFSLLNHNLSPQNHNAFVWSDWLAVNQILVSWMGKVQIEAHLYTSGTVLLALCKQVQHFLPCRFQLIDWGEICGFLNCIAQLFSVTDFSMLQSFFRSVFSFCSH